MTIIPSIDLKNGKCVRLAQGRDDATREYALDPVSLAAQWEKEGATRIHIVNLDGAFGRGSWNSTIVAEIIGRVGVAIQFGGGLRSLEGIQQALDMGCEKIVLGTIATQDPSMLAEALSRFGPARIIVALDARRGKVVSHGWTRVTGQKLADAALTMKLAGVTEILSTSVAKDGMLLGPDLDLLKEISAIGVNILASGGVSSADDVREIVALGLPAITGIVVGKALYEGRVTLPDLLRACHDGKRKV